MQWLRLASVCGVLLSLAGCVSLPHRDPINIEVVDVQSLQGAGMELRFAVKLRVQNPNEGAIEYNGAALQLDLNGHKLATGVSDQTGTVPRFGEAMVTIPVTVSATGVMRQLLQWTEQPPSTLKYKVTGKLAGGAFGTRRFSGEGQLDLPDAAGRGDKL